MNLTQELFEFANLGAEWVLWLLLVLSVASVAVMAERAHYLFTRRADVRELQTRLTNLLSEAQLDQAAREFRTLKCMEGKVLHAGLGMHHLGVSSVTELMTGAMTEQKAQYERTLPFLATLGSNAPFIGLFGTVLGIIQAFARFEIQGGPEASAGIMAAISEALIATGVGLLVAIPAIVAFNYFRTRIQRAVSNTDRLVRTLLAFLSADIEAAAQPRGDA